MNNQKVPMIILSECVVFPGSSVYLNLYDSRSENAVSQAIGPGGKLVGVTRMPAETADDDHSKLYSVGTLLEVKQMNTPRKGHRVRGRFPDDPCDGQHSQCPAKKICGI